MIGKSTGRGGPVRNLRGCRGTGPYPARGCGFRGRGIGATMYRHMGGKTDKLNALAKETWLWCRDRAIWLSATHIPRIENEAEFCSRNFNDNVEWKLN